MPAEPLRLLAIRRADTTDELAAAAVSALLETWKVYQTGTTARQRTSARARLRKVAAILSGRLPGRRAVEVAITYERMARVAREALETFREDPAALTPGPARDDALNRALEEAQHEAGKDAAAVTDALRAMSPTRWRHGRRDGVARYLTARLLGISESSVNVQKWRAAHPRRRLALRAGRSGTSPAS
jgi:hypothetical protein